MGTARTPAVEAVGLCLRRHRPLRAPGPMLLADCSFRIPRGAVCGLVGPNGAGKSLLLAAAAGLLAPSAGVLTVLGRPAGSDALLAETGFVGQQRPLYHRLTVTELLSMGRRLNPRWRPEQAGELLELGRISGSTRAGDLSGGQRTLLALALARGKAPHLLLLDEPLADLDPLVRRTVLGLLLADTTDNDSTVLLSSHVLPDLEEAVDHLLLVDGGRIRLAGPVPELLAAHRFHGSRLVRAAGPTTERPSLEELVVHYLGAPTADAWLAPGMRPQRGGGEAVA
ncbi:ATP-binding cassette domain-containing protein [Streptacidiphilus sp. N1-3]|uniref:ATP-binding cassette domain-containing protein n=1 Tax=Streptacidiphilus alkalitolerans TaxID=3342712 RepID=A0ABV6XDR8_9ACTN